MTAPLALSAWPAGKNTHILLFLLFFNLPRPMGLRHRTTEYPVQQSDPLVKGPVRQRAGKALKG